MAQSSDSFSDLQEFGIDSEAEDDTSELFTKAANHLPSLLPNVDNHTLTMLYAYYKQGIEGPCKIARPSWFDLKGKTKWEAWNKLGNMSQTRAKLSYIEIIKSLDKDFLTSKSSKKESWVTVSTLQSAIEEVDQSEKSLVDYIKEGNHSLVLNCLETLDKNKLKTCINELDEEGLGLVHWASDRGSPDILKLLIEKGADVNLPDCDEQTPLHYAASCGHVNCVKLLLDKGAKVDIKDVNGDTPFMVSSEDTIKILLDK